MPKEEKGVPDMFWTEVAGAAVGCFRVVVLRGIMLVRWGFKV